MEEKDRLTSVVKSLVEDCESYREESEKDRTRSTEYFDGKMTDVPHQEGRSQVVTRDVRSNIKKVLPSMVRTLLGNDKVVEYEPVGEDDEESAEQASDYINYVVFPESNGYEAVQDAIHDALKMRNGIVRWYRDKKITVSVSSHTGLDDMALTQLIADDDVTVLEQEQTEEMQVGPDGQPVPTVLYNVKIRKRSIVGRTKLEAVPPEKFLIHPDALDIEESPIVGLNDRYRRSDLVAMGYDRDLIDSVPAAGISDDKQDEESTRRRDLYNHGEDDTPKELQELEYYELYVRVDEDDDGIAELRRLVYVGSVKAEYLLENEEWDEVPFADIITERRPHQREGVSVSDDLMEIQKIKTVLLRETLDNIYWQNKPQPIVQDGTISNPDAVLSPAFGKTIRTKQGVDVRGALGFTQVPFVAAQSFSMMEYLDNEAADRTGISDTSSGLSPDALQNMTAKATALLEQSGIGQTELMVRTSARGFKRVFKGLLKLTIKHQDKPRTVRLRKKWVTFDPRPWNAEMDATVNVGLGAGTRERDMMAVQAIMNLQEKLLASLGAVNNPFVKPENLYNAITKFVEAVGLPSGDMFFTKPTPEELQALMESQANQPNPEMEKAKMQAQTEQAKAQNQMQIAQMQAQMEERIEMAKMEKEYELKRYQLDQEIALKQRQNVAQALTGQNVSTVHLGGMAG
ncbi:portal protein [Agrobacterium rubi]|uniref:Phage portal protein n=1 Tax=Agrobacterium rubi TaxID=28099 RepID=A0ABX2IXT2_9HYPH|nr:phage portal protein [Agrobacterium rubi]NTF35555.1 phage portal protein [Agrobacterium rubi]